jgi:hypothetical protein
MEKIRSTLLTSVVRLSTLNPVGPTPGPVARRRDNMAESDERDLDEERKDRQHYLAHNEENIREVRRKLLEEGNGDWVILSGDATKSPMRDLSIKGRGQDAHDADVAKWRAAGLRPSAHSALPFEGAVELLNLMKPGAGDRLALAQEQAPPGCFLAVVILERGHSLAWIAN